MNFPKLTRFPLVGLFSIIIALGLGMRETRAEESWRNLFLDTKVLVDTRYRFEFVNQSGIPKNAEANTIRTRAGLETGSWHGIGAGFDVEWIEGIGSEKYNDTINGKVQFPVVADPDDFQLNQLYVTSNDTIPHTLLKVGRQRIIWDNARFIGNVGFRQNEQTFDAFRGVIAALPDTELEYIYLEEVHRIFGTDSPVGDLGLNAHGMRVYYSGFDSITITPFALLLDYDSGGFVGLDLASYGVLLDGSHQLDEDWTLLFAGSVAYQDDYADNPSDIDLWYYRGEAGFGYGGAKLRAGYEVLEGDGTNAFQTPLATLHKFNGLTDRFLTTPANGLEDFYLSLDARLPGEGCLSDFTIKAGYHQFWAETGNSHYGWEWDAGIFKKIVTDFGAFHLGVQYASYHADTFATDTQKLWVTLQFKAVSQRLGGYVADGDG